MNTSRLCNYRDVNTFLKSFKSYVKRAGVFFVMLFSENTETKFWVSRDPDCEISAESESVNLKD